MAARRYHALRDAREGPRAELTEAEEELLALLKARGVRGICAAVSKEIHYVWAVASGFRTLRDAGHFYFACGARALGYNPARDFFAAHGLQLALFALRRFVHNEHVLVPALDCVAVFCRLDVDGALEFLAVADAAEIVLRCVRFHDNKHDVISAACQALGALVLNDAVRDALSTPGLVCELLGLVRRYAAVQPVCRAALAPLGFLVTDACAAAAFVEADGVALATAAMRTFLADAELVWHVVGLLNGLHASAFDPLAVAAAHGGTGVARIVEALAAHLDTEEVAVEGFQLLARVAAHAPRAINASRVLDLALLARFAYAGPQHRHTRRAIQAALPSFHACALRDPDELARRERSGGAGIAASAPLAALAASLALVTAWAGASDAQAADVAQAVSRLLERDAAWWSVGPAGPRARRLRDVATLADVWGFLGGPLVRVLLAPDAGQTDGMALVDRAHLLLGGVQLRRLRVRQAPCPPWPGASNSSGACFPPYAPAADADADSHGGASPHGARAVAGRLAVYPAGAGDRVLLPAPHSPRPTSQADGAPAGDCDSARCRLEALRAARWLDPRDARALVVSFNLYTPAADVHCRVQLLFELAPSGGAVLAAPARVAPLRLRAYRAPATSWAPAVGAELALLGCLLWLAAAQAARLARYRWLYLSLRRHVLDAAIVAVGAAAVAARALSLAAAPYALRRRLALSVLADRDVVALDEAAHRARVERDVLACLGALVWWRLLRAACRGLRALEAAFDRAAASRGAACLEALGWLLALAVVGAAHAAVLVDESAGAGGLGDAILRMAAMAVQRWRREDTLRGRGADGDASAALSEASAVPLEVVRLALELASLLVMLSIAAAVLRDRFDSSAARSAPDAEASRRADELRLLDLAKQRLEAHGLRVHETSLAKKLRAGAVAGLERLQSAVLARADDSLELFDLRRAWGLPPSPGDGEDGGGEDGGGSGSPAEARRSKLESVPITRLYAAEQRERELEQRLSEMAMRVKGAAEHLGQFQRVVRQEMLAGADATGGGHVGGQEDCALTGDEAPEGDGAAAAVAVASGEL